ncbi:hypothetical protein D6833_02060 [Candidatus Parcubacteria bacterium]|nr:MAG: hypothetical protein D6833_02060 [Candidatus Parcubacteria bacterium]
MATARAPPTTARCASFRSNFDRDRTTLTGDHQRNYFLFVKRQKHWQPKTIRQASAAARKFFVVLPERTDWRTFDQIRTKDHDTLPTVLTRQQVDAMTCWPTSA